MADQRPSEWSGIPSPGETGWAGWCRHWLAAHSPLELTQRVTTTGVSARTHGRLLWRHLVDRRAALETELAQEEADGITDRALQVREADRLQELDEIRGMIRVLETIGPHLPDR